MILALLPVIFLRSIAAATPLCFVKRDSISAPSEVAKYLLRVYVYGKPDRMNAKDFAKENNTSAREVVDRYSASGDLLCGTRGSQAQLVVKNNIVLVAHHALPGSPCIDEKALDRCKFTFTENGKPKEYAIKRLIKGGKTCKPGFENTRSEDWAVIELDKFVGRSIKPYQITVAPCASNSKPVDVVAVGKSVDVGPAPSKGWAHWTKHYGNCQLRSGNCGQQFPSLLSDCDTSGGTSGGGMFLGGANPRLIGIVSGGGRSCDIPHPADQGDYDEFCWNSEYAPIAGELKTLLDSVGDSAPSTRSGQPLDPNPLDKQPIRRPIESQDL